MRPTTCVMTAATAAMAFTLLACDGRLLPLAPAEPPRATIAAQPGFDISGAWNWREDVTTNIPPEIVQLLGLHPEGPVTHATCDAAGTLQLVQTGSEFTGTATQQATCRTSGGQEFAAFPPYLSIEGQIAGRSLHFQLGECTYVAVVSLDAGAAVGIRGTGTCHDLPPGALLKSTRWEAVRQ